MTVVGRRSGWRGYFTPGERERERAREETETDRTVDYGNMNWFFILLSSTSHSARIGTLNEGWTDWRLAQRAAKYEVRSLGPRDSPWLRSPTAAMWSSSAVYIWITRRPFFANEADRWKSETLSPRSLSDLFPDVSLKGEIKENKQICICGLFSLFFLVSVLAFIWHDLKLFERIYCEAPCVFIDGGLRSGSL